MGGHWQRSEYTISTDKSRLDIGVIHSFLDISYWAAGRSVETIRRSIENSTGRSSYTNACSHTRRRQRRGCHTFVAKTVPQNRAGHDLCASGPHCRARGVVTPTYARPKPGARAAPLRRSRWSAPYRAMEHCRRARDRRRVVSALFVEALASD